MSDSEGLPEDEVDEGTVAGSQCPHGAVLGESEASCEQMAGHFGPHSGAGATWSLPGRSIPCDCDVCSAALGRPGWDTYFLGIAEAVKVRADCTRRKVGAVLAVDNLLVSSGYNGAPSGARGCATDGACPRGQLSHEELEEYAPYEGEGECIALHAEHNALRGRLHLHGTLYVTARPCDMCWNLIESSNVNRVVWPEGVWVR